MRKGRIFQNDNKQNKIPDTQEKLSCKVKNEISPANRESQILGKRAIKQKQKWKTFT